MYAQNFHRWHLADTCLQSTGLRWGELRDAGVLLQAATEAKTVQKFTETL